MMVRILFFIVGLSVLLSGCISSSAITEQLDEKKVRLLISSKVKKSYPKAIVLSLAKEVKNDKAYYSVEIKQQSERKRLLYNSQALLVELEETVRPEGLPVAVKKRVGKKYPQGTVLYAQKLVRRKSVTYTIAVKNGAQREEIILYGSGKPVKPPKQ